MTVESIPPVTVRRELKAYQITGIRGGVNSAQNIAHSSDSSHVASP